MVIDSRCKLLIKQRTHFRVVVLVTLNRNLVNLMQLGIRTYDFEMIISLKRYWIKIIAFSSVFVCFETITVYLLRSVWLISGYLGLVAIMKLIFVIFAYIGI